MHTLILRAGAVVILDGARVYYDTLIDEGGSVLVPGGCGQLVQVTCAANFDCSDGNPCTLDTCSTAACHHEPGFFGDVNGDGAVDLLDILCVLDGFNGLFGACPLAASDIGGCSADGFIDLLDLTAVLDAYRGAATCCGN